MAKKTLRQAMRVSIKELRDLADEMLKEGLETNAEIGISDPKMLERKWLISIINKQPKCGDTWEIEKGRELKISKKINKKFYEATKRLHARKKKIKHSQIDDLIQKVRYGKKTKKK
jgi:hypothetical protein